jgi:hypothetical protein
MLCCAVLCFALSECGLSLLLASLDLPGSYLAAIVVIILALLRVGVVVLIQSAPVLMFPIARQH